MSEKPIPALLASYNEVRFDGKRLFELGADSIRVSGSRTLQSHVDTTIPLRHLDPRVSRLHVRHGAFWAGLGVALVSFISWEVLVDGFKLDAFEHAAGLIMGVGISGAVLCLATVRKTEFAQFVSDAGVPVLDIARAGPERDKFEEFVNQVLEQVRTARSRA